jgi:hypothetical protein
MRPRPRVFTAHSSCELSTGCLYRLAVWDFRRTNAHKNARSTPSGREAIVLRRSRRAAKGKCALRASTRERSIGIARSAVSFKPGSATRGKWHAHPRLTPDPRNVHAAGPAQTICYAAARGFSPAGPVSIIPARLTPPEPGPMPEPYQLELIRTYATSGFTAVVTINSGALIAGLSQVKNIDFAPPVAIAIALLIWAVGVTSGVATWGAAFNGVVYRA